MNLYATLVDAITGKEVGSRLFLECVFQCDARGRLIVDLDREVKLVAPYESVFRLNLIATNGNELVARFPTFTAKKGDTYALKYSDA